MHRIRNPAYRFSCTEGSNPSLSASDFFQYFNSSNACLQAVDLIEFFSKEMLVRILSGRYDGQLAKKWLP